MTCAMRVATCLILALTARADITVTFPQALERAMRLRTVASTTFEQQASMLEALPFRTLPTVRAETGIPSALVRRASAA